MNNTEIGSVRTTIDGYDDYRFTGHERDDEAGLTLDYMNARNYDPVLGRFMQVDPHHNSYPGWSLYVYSFNNPVNFTDPTGMDPCEDGDWLCQINEFIGTILSISKEVNLKIDVGMFSE